MDVWAEYWPWLVVVVWLITYELIAVWSAPPTLSQLVWRAGERWRWLWLAMLALWVVLYGHFFLGWWK
jgi:hypothetical protein